MEPWARWALAAAGGRCAAVDASTGDAAASEGAEVALYERGVAEPRRRWRLRKGARRLRFLGGCLTATDRGGSASLLPRDGEARCVAEPPGLLLDAAADPVAGRLYVCDRDEKARVSRLPRVDCVLAYCLGHAEFVSCLEPLPGGDALATGSGDGSIALWRASDGRRAAELDAGDEPDEAPAPRLAGRPRPVARLAVVLSAGGCLLAATRYASDRLLAFEVRGDAAAPAWRRLPAVRLPGVPLDLAADGDSVRVCFAQDGAVRMQRWRLSADAPAALRLDETLPVAEEEARRRPDPYAELAALFKKRADGAAEYAERKRRRIAAE